MSTKKREQSKAIGISGLFLAAVLILISAFLSSLAYEKPQPSYIPVFESPSGRSVTGLATTFTSICTDDKTILKVEGNTNAKAAAYDSTTYTKRICADALLGTGHTCKYATTAAPTTTTALPSYCSNTAWDGDESDQNCGGSCNKCSAGYYCWANSDCSSNNCDFTNAVAGKPAGYRSTNVADIKYQGFCKVGTAQQTTTSTTTTSGGSSGVSVGTPLTTGAIADVTGAEFIPSISPTMGGSLGGSTGPLITTTTATAPSTPINRIIRIGSDGSVEKAGYSGTSATTTTPTAQTYTGTVTHCEAQRTMAQITSIGPGTGARCTPPVGPSGTKLLGIIDEYNGLGTWYNGYGIYVSNTVDGEIIKNEDCSRGLACPLPSCTKGTLQAEIVESAKSGYPYVRFGICATKKIKVASCSESVKGRTCTTNPPESGLTKFSGYITDIINKIDGSRTFVYYDLYIQSQETVQQTVPVTYTDVCFGDGPYHYEPKAQRTINKANGGCDSGSCIFTISADTGARVAACTSTNPNDIYPISVCSGGYCAGDDCSQIGCQTQSSCGSNNNCAWDPFEKITTKCKSKTGAAICNRFGIKLCTPAAFRSGDYSCLRKDKDTGYYIDACVGAGEFGFWHPVEVY